MTKNVKPVTDWTDLPPFNSDPNVPTAAFSDSVAIEQISNDIIADVMAAASSSSPLSLIAIAIKTEQRAGEPPRLNVIQLRTKDKIFFFKVRSAFPISRDLN